MKRCDKCGSDDVSPVYPRGVKCNSCGKVSSGKGVPRKESRDERAINDTFNDLERGD